MGLLDDAIREHLDLKRRRGADPAEIERDEREALGPVRRDPLGSEEPVASPLPPEHVSDDDLALASQAWSDSFEDEPADPELGEAAPLSTPASPPPPPARASEPFTIRDEPAVEYFDHDEVVRHDPPPDSASPDAESEPTTALEREERYAVEPAPGPRSSDVPVAPPPSPPEDEVLGETVEYDVEHSFKPGDEGEEDVLEETPEFLQDTPDHDRLWFEQRPPRDFDFDN